MDTLARIAAFGAGAALSLWVVLSAIRQLVLPRGDPVMLTRWVFVTVRSPFMLWVNRAKSYEDRDRAMALYAPIALVLLPIAWIAIVLFAFTAIFWSLGVESLHDAFAESGSSLLTLGIAPPPDMPTKVVAFAEAGLGLGLVGLMISYLPSIYAAFQRRELAVAQLATRAGDPPSAAEMILRYHALGRLEAIDEIWDEWERWFADVEETHSSQAALVFFRSISHDRSWITSAGVVLDTASLRAAVLDLPRDPTAELCIRAGYNALRRIAGFFDIAFDSDPRPEDAISIDRSEFDDVYERLATAGVPLRPDRDQAWRDFAGWRVNYDVPLLGLAGLTMAPYALWSSDRSFAYRRPRLVPLRRRGPR